MKLADAVAGAAGGAVIGLAVSILVNIALIEISTNAFFALLFGVLLLFLGGLIFFRVYTTETQQHQDKHYSYHDREWQHVCGLMCG
jgi:uncharacterized protein YacL